MAVNLGVTRTTRFRFDDTNNNGVLDAGEFVYDFDEPGVFDPGDILFTRVVIQNSGNSAATSVTFEDSFTGSTIVAGSLNISPIAGNDSFTAVGNTVIRVGQTGQTAVGASGNIGDGPSSIVTGNLLTNDRGSITGDFFPGLQIVAVSSGASAQAGLFNVFADGSFNYVSAAGFEGTDSFTYTVEDAGRDGDFATKGDNLTSTATVTITVGGAAGQIWYVDTSKASNGTGTSANPFNTLQALNNSATDPDGSGDILYVKGSAAGPLTLEASQQLIGTGVELNVGGFSLAPATMSGGNPVNSVISNASTGITLAAGNTIRGITINGLAGAEVNLQDGGVSVGTLTINQASITGNGKALDIDNGGTLNVVLQELSSTGSATEGVHLQGLDGTFSAATGTIQTPAGTGFLIGAAGGATASSGGNITITYGGAITSPGGSLVNIQDRTGGSITFSGAFTEGSIGTGQTAILIDQNAGTIAFNGQMDINAGGGAGGGISITNSATGTVNFNPAGNGLDIVTVGGTGFNWVDGGTLTIQGTGNTIGAAAGRLFVGQNGTIGSAGVSFASLTSNGNVTAGPAIQLNNVDKNVTGTFNGGTVTFQQAITSDALQISNGSSADATFVGVSTLGIGAGNDAIEISGSSGTYSFTGNVTLNTGAGNAINLVNNSAGSTSFSGGNLNVDTTSGTGISATGTVIGAHTLNLTGASNSVLATSGRAINVDGVTLNATFRDVSVTGAGSTTGVFIKNSGAGGQFFVTGTGTTAGSGGTIANRNGGVDNSVTEGVGIYLESASNVSLSNMTFTGPFANFAIQGKTVNNFTLRDSTTAGSSASARDIGNSLAAATDEGVIFFDGLTGTALFTGVELRGGFADVLKILQTGGSLNFTLNDSANRQTIIGTNNALNGNDGVQIETRNAASLTATITGVEFQGARGDDVNFIATGTSSQTLSITNNTMINTHPDLAPGGTGVALASGGVGSNNNITYAITGNTIRNHEGPAIFVGLGSATGTFSGTILNNILGLDDGAYTASASNVGGIDIRAERAPSTNSTGTLNHAVRIEGNQIRDANGNGIFLRARNEGNGANGTTRLEATILNNSFAQFGPLAFAGIYLQIAGADQNAFLGVDIRNNSIDMNGADPQGHAGVVFDETGVDSLNADFYIPGYTTDNGTAAGGTFLTTSPRNNTITGNTGAGFIQNVIDDTDEVRGQNFQLAVPILAAAPPQEDWEAALLAAQAAAEAGAVQPGGTTGASGGAGDTGATGDSTDGGDATSGAGAGAGTSPQPTIVDDGVLSQAELDLIVAAAIERWAAAGATADQLAALRAVAISVADLPGLVLGESGAGTIRVDADAAGYRWFIDATPGADEEYEGAGSRLGAIDPTGHAGTRIDLLTVITHELGHQIGLEDSFAAAARGALMYGTINPGERRLPGADDAQAATGSPVTGAFAISPISLGTIDAGVSLTIEWRHVVDAPAEDGLVAGVTGRSTLKYVDLSVSTAEQTATSNTETTAADSLSLGDRLYHDANRNGAYDAGEGVAGVTLTLYADTNNSGLYEAGTDLAITYKEVNGTAGYQPGVDEPLPPGSTATGAVVLTATTGADGLYSFANLAPGDYIVVVDAANFTGAGVLTGKRARSGAVDPDDNVDGDNNVQGFLNGQPGQYAATRAITLAYGTETSAGPTGTANDTNNSLDMALVTPNQAPTFSATGASASYTENGAALAVSGTVTASDADSANYAGGTFSATLTAGSVAGDLLSLASTGGATGINVVGNSVRYNNVEIGILTSSASGLSVALDADATDAAVQALAEAVRFSSTSDNPTNATRTITFTLVDGGGTADGGQDTASFTRNVSVAPVNDAPAVTAPTNAAIGWTENATSVPLMQGVVISDPDSPASFAGGSLTINVSGGEGGINLKAGSLFSVSGGRLLYNDAGTPRDLGAISLIGSTNVAVTGLTAEATLARLNDMVDDFTFSISGDTPTAGDRTVTLTFNDGGNSGSGGALAASRTQTLTVTAVNDAPVNTVPGAQAGTEDINLVFSTANSNAITVADADVGGGNLTVTLSVANGRLTLSGTSGLTFSVGANGTATMTFSGTPAAINSALNGLIYRGNLNYEGADTVTITTSDGGATGSGGTLTDTDTIAITLADDGIIHGDGGNNNLGGTPSGDMFHLHQGGEDVANGLGGDDGFYLGGALSAGDQFDGGDGLLDTLGLQGNYGTFGAGATPFTFAPAHLVNIEILALLPGSDTRFGDTSGATYGYHLKTVDANVASGGRLVVNFNTLRAGEHVTFDGSAELDGVFFTYGGQGNDVLTGGSGDDGFYFGAGRFGAGDVANGGGGTSDQLGLQGDYSGANAVVFGAGQLSGVEFVVLLTAADARFAGNSGAAYHYDITMNDGNVAAGGEMVISANTLLSTETLRFNGAAETDGRYRVFSGDGADVLTGGRGNDEIGARGGDDRITGGLGADILRGGDGADLFIYLSTDDSRTGSVDQIMDFGTGDRIDLGAIDANVLNGAGNDAFRFIGSAAFTGGGAGGAGELRAVNNAGVWSVEGDTNGDGVADFVLQVTTADPAFPLVEASFAL